MGRVDFETHSPTLTTLSVAVKSDVANPLLLKRPLDSSAEESSSCCKRCWDDADLISERVVAGAIDAVWADCKARIQCSGAPYSYLSASMRSPPFPKVGSRRSEFPISAKKT